MASIVADRVFETSTTTGTGAISLAGAIVGYRAFSSVCAVGDTFSYFVEALAANGSLSGDWETGLGTYAVGNTFARTTIYASSNAGAPANFAAGTKRVALSITSVDMASAFVCAMLFGAE